MVKRMENVLRLAQLKENEGVLIHKPSNMFYLSGYTGEGVIAAGAGFQAIITDFRYTEQAERQAPGFAVLMVEKGVSHADLAYRLFKEHGLTAVRYEDDEVRVRDFERLQQAMPDMTFSSLDNAPETARRIKDAGELECIERACDISCRAFDRLLGQIKPGMTEKQLQIMLDFAMLEMGADSLAFSTIVASGENGSLPHAIPGERKVRRGEMITFDFGAKKGGYCADMTRTISLGEPKPEMRRIYETVLRAQETCEAALAPGKCCRDIDTLAREIIDGAGYQGRFGHGLGHDGGDALDDHGEHAGLLQSLGILDQLAGRLGSAALHLEAAEGGSGLGSHADVAHDVDAGVDHAADGGSHVDAALQLDAVAQGLLGEAVGGLDGLLGAHVVGAEGHVADDEGVGSALDHGLDVVDHVVHGHGDGGVIAQHDHAQGVAHQDHVDTGTLLILGRQVIITGQVDDLFTGGNHLPQFDNCLFLCHFSRPFCFLVLRGPVCALRPHDYELSVRYCRIRVVHIAR